MSDPSDYGAEDYIDDLYAQAGERAIENFTTERLRSFYDKEPTVAEKPFNALAEARRLIQTPHHTAAFIHAAIASEVMLRGVVLQPILLGFIHSDSIAPFIVKLAMSSSGLKKFDDLLVKVFQDVSKLSLKTHVRTGGIKTLWEDILWVQQYRDKIMHRAEVVTKDEAEQAVAVATAITDELFPIFAKSLGYHLHDGFRLCKNPICHFPPEIRKLIEG